MSESTCPGCLERDAVIAALLQRVQGLEQEVQQQEQQLRDLRARLGQNASNSSLPPSSNPPTAPKPVVKKRTGRKPGGQRGHRGHQRLRLPPERLTHVIPLVPSHCDNCQAALPSNPSPADPDPTWHQFAELPRLAAVVTEFQGQARTCPDCGHVTHHPIPAEIKAHSVGPRLAATLSYLGGCQHISKRGLEEVVETLWGLPISLGTISALEQQMSQALQPAHQEIAEVVQQARVKNVDETGWKQAGQKRWLWAAVTATAVYFLIQLRRSAGALQALLGKVVVGVVCSDRLSTYKSIPLSQRQVCWAHLQRDFQAMVDRGGEGGPIGAALLAQTDILFRQWYKVRDGTRQRPWFRRQVETRLRPEIVTLLQRGAACGCAQTAGTCAEILQVEAALWTFAHHAGVEPTNNAAERALRPAVLWRKGSFGCHSEAGCRFVERLLSVTQTLRLQKRAVLDYLVGALVAQRHGLPTPKLFPAD